jgi:hypothetical protein
MAARPFPVSLNDHHRRPDRRPGGYAMTVKLPVKCRVAALAASTGQDQNVGLEVQVGQLPGIHFPGLARLAQPAW